MTKIVLVAVVAAFVAALGATTAGAATGDVGTGKSVHQNYVQPLMTPAPDAGISDVSGNYALRTCQVTPSPPNSIPGSQCYDPYQMRHAYGVDSLIGGGYDGSCKTIVIIDAFDGINLQLGFNTFNAYYGLPAQTISQVYLGPTAPNAGWSEEMQLDVDWSHAIAPGANIVLVHGQTNSDTDLVAALNYAIDNNLGDVVSMSFGESDQCLGGTLTAAWHQAFVNATRKGITLFASSGDQGAAQPSCDGNSWIKSTSSPASDPLVTGVGGTELVATDYTCLLTASCPAGYVAGSWVSETGWNEGPLFGDFQPYFGATESGGGGFSTVWSEPAYQQGTIHGGKTRGEPDVSYNGAILHGVLTYLPPGVTNQAPAGGWFRFGGTSAGSPQWAAITAIGDQMAGHDYGFINSALYKVGQSAPSYAAAFHDITVGDNSALEFDASNNPVVIPGFTAGTGWDADTGLGTPMAGGLLSQLGQVWSAGQGNAAIQNSKNG